MARYIELNAVVAEINKRITDAPINNIGHQRVWAYNDVKDILSTLEAKEVDLDALGVLAEHLIACDAHLVTPKYTDKELDLLEEWAKNNKPQKGEKRKSIWHPMSEIRKIDYPCDVFLHGYGSDIWIADINEACEKSTAQEWAHIDDVLEATGIKTKEK